MSSANTDSDESSATSSSKEEASTSSGMRSCFKHYQRLVYLDSSDSEDSESKAAKGEEKEKPRPPKATYLSPSLQNKQIEIELCQQLSQLAEGFGCCQRNHTRCAFTAPAMPALVGDGFARLVVEECGESSSQSPKSSSNLTEECVSSSTIDEEDFAQVEGQGGLSEEEAALQLL